MMDMVTVSVHSGTMDALIDEHMQWMAEPRQGYSARTIGERRHVLHHANRNLPRGLGDVWPAEIHSYTHRKGLSEWTTCTYHSHLCGFYRWVVAEGCFSYDPTEDLPTPPHGPLEPKPLEPEEIRFILDHSPEPWLTVAILAIGAGLRASEIAALVREDVTESYVHVRHGKGDKPRWVDTSATVWRHVRNRPPGPLVLRPYGRGPVTGHYLSCRQRAHWLSLGLPHVHLHRLRHTFCTTMFAAGHDALVLRKLMGHASVLTTQGYARVSAHQRRAAITAVDELMGTRAGL